MIDNSLKNIQEIAEGKSASNAINIKQKIGKPPVNPMHNLKKLYTPEKVSNPQSDSPNQTMIEISSNNDGELDQIIDADFKSPKLHYFDKGEQISKINQNTSTLEFEQNHQSYQQPTSSIQLAIENMRQKHELKISSVHIIEQQIEQLSKKAISTGSYKIAEPLDRIENKYNQYPNFKNSQQENSKQHHYSYQNYDNHFLESNTNLNHHEQSNENIQQQTLINQNLTKIFSASPQNHEILHKRQNSLIGSLNDNSRQYKQVNQQVDRQDFTIQKQNLEQNAKFKNHINIQQQREDSINLINYNKSQINQNQQLSNTELINEKTITLNNNSRQQIFSKFHSDSSLVQEQIEHLPHVQLQQQLSTQNQYGRAPSDFICFDKENIRNKKKMRMEKIMQIRGGSQQPIALEDLNANQENSGNKIQKDNNTQKQDNAGDIVQKSNQTKIKTALNSVKAITSLTNMKKIGIQEQNKIQNPIKLQQQQNISKIDESPNPIQKSKLQINLAQFSDQLSNSNLLKTSMIIKNGNNILKKNTNYKEKLKFNLAKNQSFGNHSKNGSFVKAKEVVFCQTTKNQTSNEKNQQRLKLEAIYSRSSEKKNEMHVQNISSDSRSHAKEVIVKKVKSAYKMLVDEGKSPQSINGYYHKPSQSKDRSISIEKKSQGNKFQSNLGNHSKQGSLDLKVTPQQIINREYYAQTMITKNQSSQASRFKSNHKRLKSRKLLLDKQISENSLNRSEVTGTPIVEEFQMSPHSKIGFNYRKNYHEHKESTISQQNIQEFGLKQSVLSQSSQKSNSMNKIKLQPITRMSVVEPYHNYFNTLSKDMPLHNSIEQQNQIRNNSQDKEIMNKKIKLYQRSFINNNRNQEDYNQFRTPQNAGNAKTIVFSGNPKKEDDQSKSFLKLKIFPSSIVKSQSQHSTNQRLDKVLNKILISKFTQMQQTTSNTTLPKQNSQGLQESLKTL